jgi:hypothetical protein
LLRRVWAGAACSGSSGGSRRRRHRRAAPRPPFLRVMPGCGGEASALADPAADPAFPARRPHDLRPPSPLSPLSPSPEPHPPLHHTVKRPLPPNMVSPVLIEGCCSSPSIFPAPPLKPLSLSAPARTGQRIDQEDGPVERDAASDAARRALRRRLAAPAPALAHPLAGLLLVAVFHLPRPNRWPGLWLALP